MKASKAIKVSATKSIGKPKKPRRAISKNLSTLSATQAARSFSDLLNRVRYRGEVFVIERNGEPICEITPVKPVRLRGAEFLTLLNSLPKPDAGFWDAVEKATQQETRIPVSSWES